MNTLSWLIYAAEVFDRVSFGAGALAFFGAGGTIFALFMVPPITNFDHKTGIRLARTIAVWGGTVTLVAYVFYSALPSSKTVWLIAASEAGEAVVTSPDAIEMMGDLKAIIKKRLKDELGGEK